MTDSKVPTIESEYVLHRSPVWRARSDFIINAPLPEASRPKRYEQLFVLRVGEDRFEVCCEPFFLYDVALGDIVQTTDAPGAMFLVSGVRELSGRFVFRAWFGSVPGHPHHEIASDLAKLGALMEWASTNLLAIDAPNEEHAQRIADYLAEQQKAGLLTYETGRS